MSLSPLSPSSTSSSSIVGDDLLSVPPNFSQSEVGFFSPNKKKAPEFSVVNPEWRNVSQLLSSQFFRWRMWSPPRTTSCPTCSPVAQQVGPTECLLCRFLAGIICWYIWYTLGFMMMWFMWFMWFCCNEANITTVDGSEILVFTSFFYIPGGCLEFLPSTVWTSISW